MSRFALNGKEHPLDYVLRMRKPKESELDSAFDLVCSMNYFAGQFGQNIPVDKSREVWNKLKELIRKNGGTH